MEYRNEFRIAEIMARKFTDTVSDEEQAVLDEWIARSDVNRQTYEKFIGGESLREHNRMSAGTDADAMLKRVGQRYRSRKRRRGALRWAAAAAVFVAVAFSSVYFLGDKAMTGPGEEIFAESSPAVLILDDGTEIVLDKMPEEGISLGEEAAIVFDEETHVYAVSDEQSFVGYNTIRVPRGGICQIKLPDGSLAVINARSKLRYPLPFPKDLREVWLEGEAYFEVTPDTERPFVVNFKENSVEVLGTSFNIEAYPGKESNATIIEGSVSCRTSTDSRLLAPGYRAVIAENSTSISVGKADVRSVMAWTRERFSFNDEQLEEIMRELGEWYDIEVEFDDPTLKNRVFTIEANRSASINSILDILVEMGKIRYAQDGRKLTIYDN